MLRTFRNLLTYRGFLFELSKREIKNKYLNSGIGFLWLFLTPILLLGIYYFVFEKIFQIKFNTLAGFDFIAFIAVGLWPWVAFSEGLSAATVSIDKHIDLLKKIKLPRSLLVLIEVMVPYLIHGAGLLVALLLMTFLLKQQFVFSMLPVMLVIFLLNAVLCYGLGLLLASFQVFLKDVSQLLSPVLMVWFYLTPVIYPQNLIPADLLWLFQLNPMSVFVNAYRDTLLAGHLPTLLDWGVMLLLAMVMLFIGSWFFQRLSSRFEDMY